MADYPRTLSRAEVESIYGRFRWKANGSQFITILGNWVEQNITTVHIPELSGCNTYGGKFNGRVRWHRKGVEQLQRAWAEIGKQGFCDDVVMWGGSFVPRRMRGASSLSRHSWGTAFDINPSENPFRGKPAPQGKRGCVLRLVPILEKHGFAWGGRWLGNCDGMHFELAKVIDYDTVKEVPQAMLVINDEWQKAVPLTLKNGIAYMPLSELAAATGDKGVTDQREVPVAQYLGSRGYLIKWNNEQKKVYAYST